MTKAKTAGGSWCSQHHQERSQCNPEVDSHVHSVRCGDGLMARVAAKSDALGLNTKNDGVKMALEAWVQDMPAPRGRRKRQEAPAGDLAATVADLRAQIEDMQERMSPSVTPSPVPFKSAAVKR